MKIDFFDKELTTVWERFNQTFGKQIVCHYDTRCRIIISIIHMGMLADKINKAGNKVMVRDDIRMFVRIKNTLMNIFSNAEKYWQERRRYEKYNQTKRRSVQRSHVR